jgi:hypothetical protein
LGKRPLQFTKKIRAELIRCRGDFQYFSKKYLKIVDKHGKLVHLVPNRAQRSFLAAHAKNPWVYVLKARKLGLTTIIAAYNFWCTLFTPNYSVLVLAHTDIAAKQIFRIYTRFYDNLPAFMSFSIKLLNKHELMLEHGGYIHAATAGSDSARGSTYQSIHCSEFAMYDKIDSLIASAMSTAGENATVVLETTANGLNEAHRLFYGDNGFEKLFISWKDAEDAVSDKKPSWIPKEIKQISDQYGLKKKQMYWAVETYTKKCAANWNTFLQEYPLEAHLAFISAGRKFFNRIFPHVKAAPGYHQYQERLKYSAYVIGVDSASGSDHGDYSCFVTINCTDKKKPSIASVLYERIPPSAFAQKVLDEAKKYDALVCVESNGYGLSVIEYLTGHEWGNLYRRTRYDRASNRWTENLGFNTNVSTRSVMLARLQEYISMEWLDVVDDTLKSEMNTFVFNKNGKAEADVGKHDDCIMGTALALMGMDQCEPEVEVKKREKPGSISEMLQFELQTGKLYRKSSHFFEQEEETLPSPSEVLYRD